VELVAFSMLVSLKGRGNLISQFEEAASPVAESYLTKNIGRRSKKAAKAGENDRKISV
jgi:hypothetical protein